MDDRSVRLTPGQMADLVATEAIKTNLACKPVTENDATSVRLHRAAQRSPWFQFEFASEYFFIRVDAGFSSVINETSAEGQIELVTELVHAASRYCSGDFAYRSRRRLITRREYQIICVRGENLSFELSKGRGLTKWERLEDDSTR